MTIYTNDTALHKALFATIEGYDLIFGSLNPSSTRSELYLSTEEMPDIGAFRAEITRSFGDAIGISPRLGAVSLIGFGIGSRPAALFEALKVVRQKDIDVIETFTEREALTFVVPVKRVTDGVRVLHAAFIENEVDSSECDRGNEIAPPGNRTSRDSYHEDLRTSRV